MIWRTSCLLMYTHKLSPPAKWKRSLPLNWKLVRIALVNLVEKSFEDIQSFIKAIPNRSPNPVIQKIIYVLATWKQIQLPELQCLILFYQKECVLDRYTKWWKAPHSERWDNETEGPGDERARASEAARCRSPVPDHSEQECWVIWSAGGGQERTQ